MSEFWKNHFDKVLLATLFLIGLGAFLHFSRGAEFYATDQNREALSDIIRWIEEIVGQILAALLTLLVGRSLAATAHVGPGGTVDTQVGPPTAPTAPTAKETTPKESA